MRSISELIGRVLGLMGRLSWAVSVCRSIRILGVAESLREVRRRRGGGRGLIGRFGESLLLFFLKQVFSSYGCHPALAICTQLSAIRHVKQRGVPF